MQALRKGQKESEIRSKLGKAGWKGTNVDKAILAAKLAIAREATKKTTSKAEKEYADVKLAEMLGEKPKAKKTGFKTTKVAGKEEIVLQAPKTTKKAKKKK